MSDKIKTFKPVKLGKPDTHYFQARMTKGCESVKQSATSRIGELEKELYYCQQEGGEKDEIIETQKHDQTELINQTQSLQAKNKKLVEAISDFINCDVNDWRTQDAAYEKLETLLKELDKDSE